MREMKEQSGRGKKAKARKESTLKPKVERAALWIRISGIPTHNPVQKARAEARRIGTGREREEDKDFRVSRAVGSITNETVLWVPKARARHMRSSMVQPCTPTRSFWTSKIQIPNSISMDVWSVRITKMWNTFKKLLAQQLSLPDKVQVDPRQMNSCMYCYRVKMLKLWKRRSVWQTISSIQCLISMLHGKEAQEINLKVLAKTPKGEATWPGEENIKIMRSRMQREPKDIGPEEIWAYRRVCTAIQFPTRTTLCVYTFNMCANVVMFIVISETLPNYIIDAMFGKKTVWCQYMPIHTNNIYIPTTNHCKSHL